MYKFNRSCSDSWDDVSNALIAVAAALVKPNLEARN